jgi:hypothetical protein
MPRNIGGRKEGAQRKKKINDAGEGQRMARNVIRILRLRGGRTRRSAQDAGMPGDEVAVPAVGQC